MDFFPWPGEPGLHGYTDLAVIDPAEFAGREDEGILYVPKAGETLIRLAP